MSGVLVVPPIAHGLVGRTDLPIPAWLFGWGAAVVLVVSFVALAVLWPRPRLEGARERRVLHVPAWLEIPFGLIGIGLFVLIVYAGLEGAQVDTANLTPTFVYVLFWVGLLPLQVLFGDVFALFNPWRAVGRAAGWLSSRIAGDALPEPMAYPERLGRWPAAIGILCFAWLELVSTSRSDPSTLAVLILAYAAIQLVGMSLYGVSQWERYGDAFAVYFNLFARLSPLRWERGTLYVRALLSGVTTLDAVPGTVAVLCTMIGTTTFDGFSNGPVWSDLAPKVTDVFTSIGFGQATALQLAFTVGLLVVVADRRRCCTGGERPGCGRSRPSTRRPGSRGRSCTRSTPIALAYAVAHYFSFLAYQGQALAYLAANPLGRTLAEGDNGWLGTANWGIDYTWVGATDHLVRPGRRARPRPRGGPGARPRPRAQGLPRPDGGDPLAILDARGHGRLHEPRALAAVGPMTAVRRRSPTPGTGSRRCSTSRRSRSSCARCCGRAGARSGARAAPRSSTPACSWRMSCARPSGVSRSTGQPIRCIPLPSTSTT